MARDKKQKNLDLQSSGLEKKGIGQYILFFCLLLYTLFCFLPVLLVFVAAFTDEKYITQHGFSFFPKEFSTAGFNAVLRYGTQLATSYGKLIRTLINGIQVLK